MFKKDQIEHGGGPTPTTGKQTPRSSSAPRTGPATIGPSITVRGEVTGDEDLIVQGRIEGTVTLAKHNVTVGPGGKVTADVHGKTVVVEGEVVGDLEALEQIILRHTAVVEGNLKAPRVALEDGAVFRGGIEMDSSAKASGRSKAAAPEAPRGGGADERETSKGPLPHSQSAAASG